MPSRKIYSGDYEAKLARVMERLGAESYNYDWTRAACFIEFIYHGQLYRFEHSVEKAKTHGQNIVHVSDLFAQLVMTLEDIARMTERGIYELQSWIEGMKALPAPRAAVRAAAIQSASRARASATSAARSCQKRLYPSP